MFINIFSIILIIIIIFIFFKSKTKKELLINCIILNTFTEIFIEQGYFIKLNNITISYRLLTELILLFVSFINFKNLSNIEQGFSKKSIIFLIIIIIGIINLLLFPTGIYFSNGNINWDLMINGAIFEKISINSFVILESFQMLLFIINITITYKLLKKDDYISLFYKFSKLIKFMLIIGLFEFIFKYILNSNLYNSFCSIFFGKSIATVSSLSQRGSGYILQGFTTEASHYAYTLFLCIIYLSALNKMTCKEKKWIIISTIYMIFSMSFSAYLFIGGLIILFLTYWLYKSDRQKKVIFAKVSLLIFIFMLLVYFLYISFDKIFNNLSINDFLQRRIKSLIEELAYIRDGTWLNQSTSLEWSNRVRLGSAYETLKLIKYRPLFGLGIASVTSHGSTTMLLAGTGILGTIFWVKNAFYNKSNLNYINRKYYLISVIIWLLINCLNSMGLRPFYETSVILLMLSFSIIFERTNKDEG